MADAAVRTEVVEEPCWDRGWAYVIDTALTLWVVRAPLAALMFGFLVLGLAPQAQDLLVELATDTWWRTLLFFLVLILVWAMPTHYAARLLLDTDEGYAVRLAARGPRARFLLWLQKWGPRLLATATFAAMLLAAGRSYRNVPDVSDPAVAATVRLHLVWLAIGLVIAAIAFVIYTVVRAPIGRSAPVQRAERLAAALLREPRRIWRAFTGRCFSPRRAGKNVESDLGPFLLLLMFVVFTIGPFIWPMPFAVWFPRASAVPFVLGGWIPLLAVLAAVGRHLRAPVITSVFLLSMLLPLLGDSYGVRLINAADTFADLTRRPKPAPGVLTSAVALRDAVNWWRHANGAACENDATQCPRPVIVAAAGGASRAGYFTASVIGQLLDDQLKLEGRGHGLSSAQVTNRVFAISSVSGSSVGAVMAVAALAASPDGKQPCRTRERLWFGRIITDWRSCLEALMSGDFLTPVFTGFVFRDTLRFLGPLGWSDRGTLLERSWEDQFAQLVGGRDDGHDGLRCVGSLGCPFMTLRPRREKWLPLLVLNGTSVGNGQRIATTVLDWSYEPSGGGRCPLAPREPVCQLFSQTRLFHNVLQGNAPLRLDDVRLSTGAHNSARFPIISPPGAIRDSTKRIVDRIVDGGYFENFGAQTATELASAIRAIEPRLYPFVAVLSNDPELREDLYTRRPPAGLGFGREGSFMTDISGPLKAFAHTRDARGLLAVDQVSAALDPIRPDVCNISRIRVWGETEKGKGLKARELSMSWWLSKPVQIYLHEQTEFGPDGKPKNNHHNRQAIKYLLDALGPPLPTATGTRQPDCEQ